jgi:hypothetical protein
MAAHRDFLDQEKEGESDHSCGRRGNDELFHKTPKGSGGRE